MILNLLLFIHEFNLISKPIVCHGFVKRTKMAKGPCASLSRWKINESFNSFFLLKDRKKDKTFRTFLLAS